MATVKSKPSSKRSTDRLPASSLEPGIDLRLDKWGRAGSKQSARAARSVLERIHKPSGQVRRLAACIYGRQGVGKTTLLGTMRGRGLVIDVPQIEGGTAVLADKSDRIDVAPVVLWKEIDELYQMLRLGKHDYEWVAIDTITACQHLARRKVKSEQDIVSSDAHKMRIQDYGDMGQLMTEMFYSFRLLRMNVIFLAQEKGRESDEGIREMQPGLSPMSLDALLPSMTLVGRYYMWEADDGTWERRLRVGPHTAFVTKTRAVPGRDLPPVILRPKLDNIFRYLMGDPKAKRPRKAADESSSLLDLESED